MIDRPRPHVLLLTHRLPFPPDKGDRIRSFHLLKCLARHAAVHLAALADEPVSKAALDHLGRYCHRVEVVPLGAGRWFRAAASLVSGGTVTEGAFWSPALRAVLESWAGQTRFAAAVASASSLVRYLRLPALAGVPAIVDMVDVDSEKWLAYAGTSAWPQAYLYRTEARRLRQLEQTLPGWARAVTLVSDEETNLYRRFCATGAVHTITNGVDLDFFAPDNCSKGADGCVFVGALDYRPNVEGAVWFCNEVWPQLHRRLPSARFRLVGRRPVTAIRRLADLPGVELVGQVPDVRPHVRQAAVVVAPLLIARGVQNKVLEALAMGKAVVASPQALTGLRLQDGVNVLTATTVPDWVRQIVRLYEDAALRCKFGSAGRHFVETHHRWDCCLQPFAALLRLGSDNGSGSHKPLPQLEDVA